MLPAANWFYVRKAKAAAQLNFGQAACTSFVPLEWGKYKGSSEHYGIVFRDNNGTHCFEVREPSSRFCDFVDPRKP
ncbi:MAG TPA: hypothetical protein VJX72_14050 [Candidatus Acidoferrum sp.]|nr:hypothetical protein [Candidatus Acidoferrum sp.]